MNSIWKQHINMFDGLGKPFGYDFLNYTGRDDNSINRKNLERSKGAKNFKKKKSRLKMVKKSRKNN